MIGYDDSVVARHQTPELSSVAQPMREAGAIAANTLIQGLWKGRRLKGVERVPPKLIVRGSSSYVRT